MKELLLRKKRKKGSWKRRVSFVMVLAMLFSLLPSNLVIFKLPDFGRQAKAATTITLHNRMGDAVTGSYTMRRVSDTLSIDNYTSFVAGTGGNIFTWQVNDPAVVDFVSGAARTGVQTLETAANYVPLYAKSFGRTSITVQATDTNGDVCSLTLSIEVQFSIAEGLDTANAKIARANHLATRGSLILDMKNVDMDGSTPTTDDDYLEVIVSDQEAFEAGKLNLLFASGVSGNGKTVTWTSDKKDIVSVRKLPNDETPAGSETGWRIRAVGVGHATLSVTVQEGSDTQTDKIDVFVKPRISFEEKDKTKYLNAAELEEKDSVELVDKDKGERAFRVDNVVEKSNPLEKLASKMIWVIAKPTLNASGLTDTELVKDSLGNGDGQETLRWEATPESGTASGRYVLDHEKAGSYIIQFYTIDTYTTYDEVKNITLGCEPVSVYVNVFADWTDKEKTINIDGSYDLEKAFKIPNNVLRDEFTIKWDNAYTTAGALLQDDAQKMIFTAKKTGDARFTITRNTDAATTISYLDATGTIRFIAPGESKTVTIHIGPSLQVSTSETTMKEGSRLGLSGIFSTTTGEVDESDEFTWDIAFKKTTTENVDNYLEIEQNNSQKYLSNIYAKRVTPDGNPVVVTLHWSTEDGVTQSASCEITITRSATTLILDRDTLTLASGSSEYVSTVGLTGNQNLIWKSTDEDVFTVQPNTENTTGYVTAGTKVGSAVLIVMNPDNNVTATCIVTVTQEMTSLKIREGNTLEVDLGKGFITLHADYQPASATSTDIKWSLVSLTGANSATIDQDGTIHFTGIPDVISVTVASTNNPTPLSDSCQISIITTRIETITFPYKEITIIKGDEEQLEYTITPTDPYDKTMVWESEDPNIVTVDGTGKIKGINVGHAIVKVHGTNPDANATVLVNVTDRLQSIDFANETDTVQVGKTINLNIVYTPSENVNKNVTFTSTNPQIATVDANGLVTGITAGDVMMIAVSEELGVAGAKTCMIHVIEPIIIADDFNIEPEQKTIKEGETFEITPIFTPANPTDQTVEYESSDESVATVSPEGIVKGISVSEIPVVITCTYVPTGKVALCLVTVESKVKLKLSPTKKTIVKGRSFTIKKTITPSKFKNTPAQWKSSNTKIATVSQAGKVKAKKVGTCIITCQLVNYNVKATCTVKVTRVKTTIKLNKTSIRINIGQTYKLKSTVASNDTKKPSVRYTSKNKKVATVNKTTGKIKGKKVGSTVITARTTDAAHATAKCRVTVIRRATSLNLNKNYAICFIGGTIRLKATVKPKNASIKKLQWSSSDNAIAAVNQNGKVSGLQQGDIYITVKTTDGSNLSDRCYVRVMEEIPASSVTVAQPRLTMKKGDTANLSFTILPTNTTDTVSMASDNKRVATVTNAGKITAVGTGTATITIMTSSGITSTVEVHVVDLNKSSIRMRQYDTETLVVTGTEDTITWYSANNRIADVSNGTVTGRAIGTTYIYAYVDGCKLACKVQIVSVNNNQR